MKLAHLTTTEDGGSRFGEIEIRLGDTATDPWGNIVNRSETFPVVGSMIMEMREGLMMDWHASARASFIVVLSGTVESRPLTARSAAGAPARCSSLTIAAAVVTAPVPSAGRHASYFFTRPTNPNPGEREVV